MRDVFCIPDNVTRVGPSSTRELLMATALRTAIVAENRCKAANCFIENGDVSENEFETTSNRLLVLWKLQEQ